DGRSARVERDHRAEDVEVLGPAADQAAQVLPLAGETDRLRQPAGGRERDVGRRPRLETAEGNAGGDLDLPAALARREQRDGGLAAIHLHIDRARAGGILEAAQGGGEMDGARVGRRATLGDLAVTVMGVSPSPGTLAGVADSESS